MLKNKYLRYSPDITFEVFKKIWDKLVATGWRPFVSSTGAKDMYKKWREGSILTYGPSYSPNTFGVYDEDATLSDDKEVFVGDLIQSSQKSFTLPTNWYVSLNEVSRETLERYVKRKFRTIKGYIYVGGSWSASIHEGYTEISLEQFTEHVVKEKVTEKETFCVQGDGSSWFGKMLLDYLKDRGGKESTIWSYDVVGYFSINADSYISWLGNNPVGRIVSKDEVMQHFCYRGAIKGGVGRHGKAVIAHLKEKGATKNINWTGCDELFYYIVVKDGAYTLDQSRIIPEGYHEEFINPSTYNYTEVPIAEIEDTCVEEIEYVEDAPVPLVEVYVRPTPIVENIVNIYFPKVEEIL